MGGGEVAKLLGRWVAKLVARLLATAAALWVRIQTSLKNTEDQRSDQHTLALPKIWEKIHKKLLCRDGYFCVIMKQCTNVTVKK
jgi:hypothetical protein